VADEVLPEATVASRVAGRDGWSLVDGALARSFRFADFAEAFAFMARVALAAERLDHHPDWSNSWNRVDIRIVSHAAGGVTERCFALAAACDAAAGASAVD
jgi:4a-hydroxytetrahydrobiopterin dehydratase